MRKWFELYGPYHFERMDLASALMIVNVITIIVYNKGAYVGLPVALGGLIWDIHDRCHINAIVMRLAVIAMNIYFLTL